MKKWLRKILARLGIRQYKNKSKKLRFVRDFVEFDQVKRLGYIVNMSDFTAKELITLTDHITKLEEQGKSVYIIELNYRKKAEPMFNETVESIFLNPKHINWYEIPSISKIKEINSAKLDILVDLDISERMTAKFICGFSNARTRVGIYHEQHEGFYELMLEIEEQTPLKQKLAQFDTYLKMLHK